MRRLMLLICLGSLGFTFELICLPDRVLTPGAITGANSVEICTPGYAKRTRNVPESLKKLVYAEYKMSKDKKPCPCEVDHLVSLQLGGSNDITNLWPQPYTGEWNAHQKDALENHLHSLVCNGKIELKEAQRQISEDWISGYKEYQLWKQGNKGTINEVVE